jgi:hypothetical protein
LLERASQHVRMRDDDFSPGFQAHKMVMQGNPSHAWQLR